MMKGCVRSKLISNIHCIHSVIVSVDSHWNRQFLLPFITKYRQGNVSTYGSLPRALSISQDEVADLVERERCSNTENDIIILPGEAEDAIDNSLNMSAVKK
jgi:hypothetical protein